MLGSHILAALLGATVGVGATCCCVLAGREDNRIASLAADKLNEELFAKEVKPYCKRKREFTEATRPAVEWFNENCNPHQKIIIEMGGVELVSGEMAYPTEIPD